MQRSLFAAFRSADGRSLGHALALLVVISALFGGIAAGNAAAGDFDRHCTTSPYGVLPPGHDGISCCPGMIGGTPFIPPPADTLPDWKPTQVEASLTFPTAQWTPPAQIATSDLPRVPPALI